LKYDSLFKEGAAPRSKQLADAVLSCGPQKYALTHSVATSMTRASRALELVEWASGIELH